jgi:outer membrane immunogenic protein
MKKLLIASALSAAFVSPAVFAQAKNFEGFGLQLSTGYQNNEVKSSNLTFNGTSPSEAFGENIGFNNGSKGEMPLNIGASYTFVLTDRFTLGALVEYNPLSMKTGTSTLTYDGVTSTDPADQITGKLENQVSISLVPGYAFTDSTMGYARVGWINATAKGSVDDLTFSKNTNGILLGLGARHLFTKNIYGFAEATYASYGGSNASAMGSVAEQPTKIGVKLTPTSYSFLVGVGYRF